MFNFLKKHSGFTLAELMVTVGLIGAIGAITIPSLAYNYRAKVLEEQYRSTYSELKEMGSAINYEKGDVGEYANKVSFNTWQSDFVSRLNGGNNLSTNQGVYNIVKQLQNYYKQGGGSPGPYFFELTGNKLKQVGTDSSNYICDNGQMWTDSKGRIWTFNLENRIICVDINGSQNPNRYNIDIYAFVPMSAGMVAAFVYDDADNSDKYSGQIIPCDINAMHKDNLGNSYPTKVDGKYVKGKGGALNHCPFFYPLENVAPAGKSARGKTVTSDNNYWRDYINYK